ncbi:MAG: DUF2802 domain-containing protein [Cycloclasticus sp.]|nr:DUF2802 domain-containing protein [Cycloclasticus sp.]MBQ0790435.1 DUF2802 domain-containing protein [Cycloclasticus sp.]
MDIYLSLSTAFLVLTLTLWLIFFIKDRNFKRHLDKFAAIDSKKLESIQQDLSALCAGGLGVDERIGKIERRIRELVERVEELETNDAFENLQEFQQAIELAKKGADVAEIVEKCHLTTDEAALLIRLHKP